MTKEVSELAALAAQAETIETAATEDAQAGQGAAPAPVVQTNADLLTGVFQMGREAVCVIVGVNSPRHILADNVCAQLGQAWGAVADKRGWDLGKLMGDYAAEVAAIMLSVSVGLRLSKAVGAELDAQPKPKEAEATPSPEAAHAV